MRLTTGLVLRGITTAGTIALLGRGVPSGAILGLALGVCGGFRAIVASLSIRSMCSFAVDLAVNLVGGSDVVLLALPLVLSRPDTLLLSNATDQ